MFLELNGNNSLTAQKLFVHYNTVKYRLAQIEEILNVDLSSAEDRFNLQAALKIRKLLGK
jgi:DNA-binding PucR family transcriptional regulator